MCLEGLSARNLVDRLGNLPLPITHAGSFIAMHRQLDHDPISSYLRLYSQYPQYILSPGAAWQGQNHSIVNNLEISYQAVKERNACAAELLLVCGFLDPLDIWRQILVKVFVDSWTGMEPAPIRLHVVSLMC